MAPSPGYGTEVGFTFSFVHCERIFAMAGASPRAWLKTVAPHPEQPKRTPLCERWIYAFRFQGSGRSLLFAEYWADKKGSLSVLAGPRRLAAEPRACPPMAALGGTTVSLPITANGRATYWMFVVSDIRLACASLRALSRFQLTSPEFDGHVFAVSHGVPLPVVDLARPTSFVKPASGSPPALPVVDFVHLASALRRDYETALNTYQRYLSPLDGMSDAEKKAVSDRALKYTLARIVRKVIHSEPAVAGKVDQLALLNYLDDFEKTVAARKTAQELAARRLCAFLRSPMMTMVESWYREREGDDKYEVWLWHLDLLQGRLDESATGIACLRNPAAINQHALERYVFPLAALSAADTKKVVSTFKKVATPVTGLWSKFLPWYLAGEVSAGAKPAYRHAVRDAKEAVRWMNQLLGAEVMSFRTPPVAGRERLLGVRQLAAWTLKPRAYALAEREVGRARERLVVSKAIYDKAKAFEKSSGRPQLAGRIASDLQLGIDTINNAFKLLALLGKLPEDRRFTDYWDGASGVNSLLKGFVWEKLKDKEGLAGRIGSRGARAAGTLTGIFDAFLHGKEALEALEDDDVGSAVASGIAGAGAFAAGVVAFAAVANPLWAIAFLSVQGAASVAALLLRDASLENFLEHCSFGRKFGQSSATPPWAEGSYASWAGPDGLGQQITTVYNLITKFRVQAYNPAALTVHLGYYDEDMKVHVAYYDDRTRTPIEVTVTPATGEWYTELNSNDQRMMEVKAVGWDGDRISTFRIHFDKEWRSDKKWRSFCRVRMIRTATIAGRKEETTIPRQPTALDSREQTLFGGRPEVNTKDVGLAYPLCGSPRGANVREKASS